MNRIKVAIIFGGCSEEHDVSVKAAIEIAANIDTEKFDPHYIGITKNGVWKLCKKPCTEWEADSLPAILSPDRKTHGLLVMKESEYETRRIDVAFPVL
ncbi:TPA: D-alanine--(R)-lactate ligase VanB, partial [Enterococcus faecium]